MTRRVIADIPAQDIPGLRERAEANFAELYGLTPKLVIPSSDLWTDPDDAVGIVCLLFFEYIGLIDLMMFGIDTNLVDGPGALDALAYSCGRDNLPISVPKTSHVPSGTPSYQGVMQRNFHRTGQPQTLRNFVTDTRTALVMAQENVHFFSFGYLVNFYELITSPADSISPLTGAQLIASKGAHFWIMGGNWPSGSENNFNRTTQAKVAANYICANWPSSVPITFLGYEVAVNILTGGSVYGTANDLLAQALVDFGEPYGHSSWDPLLVLLACIGDPALVGFTTVQGTASVDASTGANTFVASANGPHRYVVKAKPDSFYANIINKIIVRSNWATYEPFPGVKARRNTALNPIGGKQIALQNRVTTTIDVANLLGQWIASDLAGLADTNTVSFWEDRTRQTPLYRATSTNRPTFKTAQYGRNAVSFVTNQSLYSQAFTAPIEFTTYARVAWSTLPSSAQCVLSQDSTVTNVRGWHLKGTTSTNVQGASFRAGGTGVTVDRSGTLVIGTWHLLALRFKFDTIEVFLDGVSSGTVARGATPNAMLLPLAMGARQYDSVANEMLVGFVSEARMYAGAHSDETMALVAADMP